MLYDITKIEESYIFPGDGASHTRVRFRFVVFRPFIEEILVGKIRSCSVDGVHGLKNLSNLKCNILLRAMLTFVFYYYSHARIL